MSAYGSAARPALTFDRLEVGRVYCDRAVTVSAETVLGYRAALGTGDATSRDPEPHEGALTPPTLLAMWTPPRVCFEDWTIPHGGVHTAQEWQSLRPVRAGDVLRQRVTVADLLRRDERRYVIFDTIFEDAAGVVVARGRMTVLWPG